MEIGFAGTKNSVCLCRKSGEKSLVLDAGRYSVGGYFNKERLFTERTAAAQAGDILYLSSDGYSDQIIRPTKESANKRFLS